MDSKNSIVMERNGKKANIHPDNVDACIKSGWVQVKSTVDDKPKRGRPKVESIGKG